jgi:hypothetical protein
MPVN